MVSLTICLKLIKDETAYKSEDGAKFANRTYLRFIDGFLKSTNLDDGTLQEFCTKYLNQYFDLQFHFLQNAGYMLCWLSLQSRRIIQKAPTPTVHQKLYTILSSLDPLLPSDESVPKIFTSLDPQPSSHLSSSYKVAFQTVWLAHLRHRFEPTQLKQLLLIVHKRIIPYMNKPQLLMDWLTDAYNTGCSLSNKIWPQVEMCLSSH